MSLVIKPQALIGSRQGRCACHAAIATWSA
jgi:hypothetical protein